MMRYMLPPTRTTPMRKTQSPAAASAVAAGRPLTVVSLIEPLTRPLIQPEAR